MTERESPSWLERQLENPDPVQRRGALRQLSLSLGPLPHVSVGKIEPYVLAAFAGGYADVRMALGIQLRTHLGIRWPMRLAQHVLEQGEVRKLATVGAGKGKPCLRPPRT